MALAAMLVALVAIPETMPAARAEGDKAAAKADSVKSVTDGNFKTEVLKSDKPVMVDFWAPWCGPCRMQGPIVEQVSEELGDKAKVVKLNTDENPKTSEAYNIKGIPALLIFKKGKVVDTMVGVRQKDQLVSAIKKHL